MASVMFAMCGIYQAISRTCAQWVLLTELPSYQHQLHFLSCPTGGRVFTLSTDVNITLLFKKKKKKIIFQKLVKELNKMRIKKKQKKTKKKNHMST